MLRKQNNTMITQFDVNSFVFDLYPKSVMGQRAPTKIAHTLERANAGHFQSRRRIYSA